MLKIKIKASQITNLTDARYFAAKEVEWLTFNFTEGTPHFIDPMRARAMFEWVSVPCIVGEFSGLTVAELGFYAQNWGIKHLQLPINDLQTTQHDLKVDSVLAEIIIEPSTTATMLVEIMLPYQNSVEAYVLNFMKHDITWSDITNNAHADLNKAALTSICARFNIILDIDFDVEMLNDILEIVPYGLSLKGGDEERVGVKSFEELDEIFDRLEVDI